MQRSKTQVLGEVISQILKEQNLQQPLLERRVVAAWETVLGKTVMQYTSDIWVQNRSLFVRITSAALRHELFLTRLQIRDKLNACAGAEVIKEIVLR